MKFISLNSSLSSLALAAIFATAQGDEKKEVVVRHANPERIAVKLAKDGAPGEKETVTFLGVETGPVDRALTAQLGLPRDVGLVVSRVVQGSPAIGALKENDVLTKFEDQILVDPRQLSVLIRARKDGDEVALTLYRGGKEITQKVKLGQRDVRVADLPRVFGGGPDGGMQFFS
ncbi:MAG: PDZ domain-containing protein, partial [Opitutae bacterium]|nr:PDZ domain-containing protein [Opitutae bacterium]